MKSLKISLVQNYTHNNMFRLFKKKSEKEKLEELYRKKKEQAFKMSRINRTESDKLEKEANDILDKIEKIK